MSTTFCAQAAVYPPRVGSRAHHLLQRAGVSEAAIAQLGERETEDLKVPSSILGLGNCGNAFFFAVSSLQAVLVPRFNVARGLATHIKAATHAHELTPGQDRTGDLQRVGLTS